MWYNLTRAGCTVRTVVGGIDKYSITVFLEKECCVITTYIPTILGTDVLYSIWSNDKPLCEIIALDRNTTFPR